MTCINDTLDTSKLGSTTYRVVCTNAEGDKLDEDGNITYNELVVVVYNPEIVNDKDYAKGLQKDISGVEGSNAICDSVEEQVPSTIDMTPQQVKDTLNTYMKSFCNVYDIEPPIIVWNNDE